MQNLLNRMAAWVIAAMVFAGAMGCVQPSEKTAVFTADGRPCGVTRGLFRHRWWNYYERGVSFQGCSQWDRAEADLREALDRADRDDRRARTYGMHFVEYFPHRELGVVLYHQTQYEEAVRELEASLSQQPSAKAEFYLDKTRKALIEQRGMDDRPPEITFSVPGEDLLTNQSAIRVAGKVTDDNYVKRVSVNGTPVRIDLARPEIVFSMDVPVSPGANAVVVDAWDLMGRHTRSVRTVLCDRSGPLFTLSDSVGARVRGAVRDDDGIRQVWLDGAPLLDRPVPEAVLDHPLPTGRSVPMIAEDMAGNRSRVRLPLRFVADSFPYGRRLWAELESDAAPRSVSDDVEPNMIRRSAVSERRVNYLLRGYLTEGKDYALIVGIDEYRHWQPLKTAVNDAAALRDILVKYYGYSPENIFLRTDADATRSSIINDLRRLAAGLTDKDNLLVYFAGHGQLDNLIQEGYWIPVEGGENDAASWVSHSVVKRIISSDRVVGRHILVIADSCYAGNLLRGGEPIRNPAMSTDLQAKVLQEAQLRSRQVIASGGLEPVADGGRDNHSLFAYYLLKSLEENATPIIDMESLFTGRVKLQVAKLGIQRPTMERLRTPMDEFGQFVLVRRDILSEAVADAAPPKGSPKPRIGMRIPGFQDSPPEEIPPDLELKRWGDENTVFLEEIFLEGAAKDASGLHRISINGENLLKTDAEKTACFNYISKLNSGDNLFVIECEDVHGNKTQKRIVVHRKLHEIEEVGSRMAMVYLPFTDQGEGHPDVKSRLQFELEHSGRFNLKPGMMRGEPEDVRAVRRFVKELGGDYWLEGRILRDGRSIDIFAGVYEADELNVMTEQNVYGEDLSQPGIEQLCQGLMVKLKDAFPLIDGYIVKVDGDKVIINRGREDGIRNGMRLIFFREGEPLVDPVTNEILEAAEIETITSARVERVGTKVGYVRPEDSEAFPELEPGLKLVME